MNTATATPTLKFRSKCPGLIFVTLNDHIVGQIAKYAQPKDDRTHGFGIWANSKWNNVISGGDYQSVKKQVIEQFAVLPADAFVDAAGARLRFMDIYMAKIAMTEAERLEREGPKKNAPVMISGEGRAPFPYPNALDGYKTQRAEGLKKAEQFQGKAVVQQRPAPLPGPKLESYKVKEFIELPLPLGHVLKKAAPAKLEKVKGPKKKPTYVPVRPRVKWRNDGQGMVALHSEDRLTYSVHLFQLTFDKGGKLEQTVEGYCADPGTMIASVNFDPKTQRITLSRHAPNKDVLGSFWKVKQAEANHANLIKYLRMAGLSALTWREGLGAAPFATVVPDREQLHYFGWAVVLEELLEDVTRDLKIGPVSYYPFSHL